MKPIEIINLTKTYKLSNNKTKIAVNELNLEVDEGIIYGFLGPNGAGKTTTIKSILDFIKPDKGIINIFGISSNNADARINIGYLPEQLYFHKFLKPIELVIMHAQLSGINNINANKHAIEALEKAGIADYKDVPISKLSKGLTQRVGIAQAIVGNPKLLILDEPTSGLDPIGRRHTRDLLMQLKKEGKTIFLSSHLLSEVENVCDVVAIMKNGVLQASGSPDSVRQSVSLLRIATRPLKSNEKERLSFINAEIDNKPDITYISTAIENLFPIMNALDAIDAKVISIETQRESLEEAFLRLAA